MATPTANSVITTTVNPLTAGLGRYTIGGDKWGGGYGTGATLTYSFPTAANHAHDPVYDGAGGAGEWLGFQTLTAGEMAASRAGLAAWAAVANIRFVEAAETASTVGEIRFGVTSTGTADEYAHAATIPRLLYLRSRKHGRRATG